jgi:hypothetical protein
MARRQILGSAVRDVVILPHVAGVGGPADTDSGDEKKNQTLRASEVHSGSGEVGGFETGDSGCSTRFIQTAALVVGKKSPSGKN